MYNSYIEKKQDEMRRGVYPSMSDSEIELFRSLYRECAGKLHGSALHNHHINYYDHANTKPGSRDTSPLYTPSRFYGFFELKETVEEGAPLQEGPDCIVCVRYPSVAVTRSFKSLCRRITARYKPVCVVC